MTLTTVRTVALAALIALASVAPAQQPGIADLLPADTLLHIELDGGPAAKHARELGLSQLLRHPDMKAFLAPMWEMVEQQMDQSVAPGLKRVGLSMGDVERLARGRLTFSLLAIRLSNGEHVPEILFTMDAKDGADALGRSARQGEGHAREGGQVRDRTRRRHRGHDLPAQGCAVPAHLPHAGDASRRGDLRGRDRARHHRQGAGREARRARRLQGRRPSGARSARAAVRVRECDRGDEARSRHGWRRRDPDDRRVRPRRRQELRVLDRSRRPGLPRPHAHRHGRGGEVRREHVRAKGQRPDARDGAGRLGVLRVPVRRCERLARLPAPDGDDRQSEQRRGPGLPRRLPSGHGLRSAQETSSITSVPRWPSTLRSRPVASFPTPASCSR